MGDITRFGVSLPSDLLAEFDRLIREMGYATRSKAIADMVREKLVENRWESGGGEVIGIVSFVYDHHTTSVVEKLLDIQHSAGGSVHSTMHIHLDHDNCLEILAYRGRPGDLKKLADRIRAVRGVKHTGLVITGNVR